MINSLQIEHSESFWIQRLLFRKILLCSSGFQEYRTASSQVCCSSLHLTSSACWLIVNHRNFLSNMTSVIIRHIHYYISSLRGSGELVAQVALEISEVLSGGLHCTLLERILKNPSYRLEWFFCSQEALFWVFSIDSFFRLLRLLYIFFQILHQSKMISDLVISSRCLLLKLRYFHLLLTCTYLRLLFCLPCQHPVIHLRREAIFHTHFFLVNWFQLSVIKIHYFLPRYWVLCFLLRHPFISSKWRIRRSRRGKYRPSIVKQRSSWSIFLAFLKSRSTSFGMKLVASFFHARQSSWNIRAILTRCQRFVFLDQLFLLSFQTHIFLTFLRRFRISCYLLSFEFALHSSLLFNRSSLIFRV